MFNKLINRIATDYLVYKGQCGLNGLEENSKNSMKVNEELLLRIVHDNKDTEYGKLHNFKDIHSIEDYKKLVPLSNYDSYRPYIKRMIKKNEKNILSAYPTVYYALSSGSAGSPKHIPVSQETIDIYSLGGAERVFATAENYYKEKYGKRFPRGRGLNTMEIKISKSENNVAEGTISGAAINSRKRFIKYMFTSPLQVIFPEEDMDTKYMKIRYALQEESLSFMVSSYMTGLVDLMNYMKENWQLLCDDIESGTINDGILVSPELKAELESELKPDPQRAQTLRAAFEEGFDAPIIPRIWPNMSWVGAIGTGGFDQYTKQMRLFTGDDIFIDFFIYAASESLLGVAKAAEEPEFVLLPDSCFFEFFLADSDDRSKTYNIDELEVGKDYEVVLTNLSGFYRYELKDVVRVTGFYNTAPIVQFRYRKNQLINIAGEKTNEESVKWAINELEKETGHPIENYAIYADTKSTPGRYVFLLEPEKKMPMNQRKKYRDILDKKMGLANPSYGSKVKSGILKPMILHYSKRDTHLAYHNMMIEKGISENQLKPVRILDTPSKKQFFLKLIEDESE